MSVQIIAPWPKVQTTLLLPAPEFSDSSASPQSVDVKRGMAGATYTYVKTHERRVLTMAFIVSKLKALEVRQFVQAYYRAPIRVVAHNGDVWQGILVTNPVIFVGEGGAGGWDGDEAVRVTLEFELTLTQAGEHAEC